MTTDIKISKRHLPHWSYQDSIYFITFRTKFETLSNHEQALMLEHIKSGHSKYYDLYAVVVMPDHALAY